MLVTINPQNQPNEENLCIIPNRQMGSQRLSKLLKVTLWISDRNGLIGKLIIQNYIIYAISYNLDFQQQRMGLLDDKLRPIKFLRVYLNKNKIQ